ncbi:hypothetical protein [Pseudoduganella sp. R-43]|uniref:hypothetical protein n=1 Tax=Pseudoduganella sp. R-43 TaxID=3404063 RepID=UPI003CEC22EF
MAGFELAHHWRFIGMTARAMPHQLRQPVAQRPQSHADFAKPFSQRRARQRHALASRDLFHPVQRQVIGEFADRHPRQKARRCHAAGNQRWLDAYPHSADVPIEPIELTVDNWLDIKAHAALFRLDFMDFLRPRIWSANGLFPTLQRPVSERSLLKFRP